jgi:hypothetical protein
VNSSERNENIGPVAIIVMLGILAAVAMAAPRSATPLQVESPTATLLPPRPSLLAFTPTATPFAPRFTPLIPTSTSTPLSVVALPIATPLSPEQWQDWPVIPTISANALAIYQRGLTLGNHPRAFSKVGDCSGTPNWFLGDFDRGPRFYDLGDYANLQSAIDYYAGSFARDSLAAHPGFQSSSLFDTLWVDPKVCAKGDGPLACEYKTQKPSLAFIMLGTNDVYHLDEFEPSLRRIIEYSIEQGVVPVLSTKADNVEKTNAVNATIARLAAEYDVPLWNYWRLAQTLPNFGLQEDGAHLNWAPNKFNEPQNMKRGWPNRNLTALQVLEAMMEAVSK